MKQEEEKMIDYLKMRLKDYLWEAKVYGTKDRFVLKEYDALVACKRMVEALIQQPVNLMTNGEVTVG